MGNASYGMCLRVGLLEGLVGPEADDSQSERIDGQFVVFHVLSEDGGHAGCPTFALQLGMIRRIGEDFHELDSRPIGRLTEIVQDDLFHLDIDVYVSTNRLPSALVNTPVNSPTSCS